MTKLETFHAAVTAHERRISAAYAELKRAQAVFNAVRDAEDKVYADLVKMSHDVYKMYTGPQ